MYPLKGQEVNLTYFHSVFEHLHWQIQILWHRMTSSEFIFAFLYANHLFI